MNRSSSSVFSDRTISVLFSEPKIPQLTTRFAHLIRAPYFSALQRAENSSIERRPAPAMHPRLISVLFSEPKIPQSRICRRVRRSTVTISVLFSEPKIPQSTLTATRC